MLAARRKLWSYWAAQGGAMSWSQHVEGETPIVDEDTVARLRGLLSDVTEEGEDLAADLLDTFHRDVERRLTDLDTALARDDRAEASEAVHALKGASATVGAPRVSALCAALERALKRGEPVDDASAQLRRAADAALAALASALVMPRDD